MKQSFFLIWKYFWGRVLCICLVCLCFTATTIIAAKTADETIPEWLQSFQNLTDAMDDLSAESTLEELKEAQTLLENTELEIEEEGGAGLTGSMSADLGPASSVQLMFAKLQLELAQMAKEQAMERLDKIQRAQEEQKQVSEYLNKARVLRQSAWDTKKKTEMPAEMRNFMDEKGINRLKEGYYDTDGKYQHEDPKVNYSWWEWDQAILQIEAYQESLGTQTQQEMVYIQDYMGQYNSYLQGANTQIANSNKTLTALARGQTMLGGEGTGLMVTCVLIGIILGVGGTLLVIRIRSRKQKKSV